MISLLVAGKSALVWDGSKIVTYFMSDDLPLCMAWSGHGSSSLYQPVLDATTDINAILPLTEGTVLNLLILSFRPGPWLFDWHLSDTSRSPPIIPHASFMDRTPINSQQDRRSWLPSRATSTTTSHIVGADELTLDDATFVMEIDGLPPGMTIPILSFCIDPWFNWRRPCDSERHQKKINIRQGNFYMGSSSRGMAPTTLQSRYWLWLELFLSGKETQTEDQLDTVCWLPCRRFIVCTPLIGS